MSNLSYFCEKTIKLISNNERQTVEFGQKAVDSGLLKNLPGPSLAIFIFILTHLNSQNCIGTSIKKIAASLPYDQSKIRETLDYMKNHDIIDIEKTNRDNLKIIPDIKKVMTESNLSRSNKKDTDLTIPKGKKSYRKKIIEKEELNPLELKKAILSFLPDELNYSQFTSEVDRWLEDFNSDLLQELLRRTEKWLSKQQNSRDQNRAFYYLKAIVDDWYNKEIFSYDRLKYFDRLYRETKELARTYGVKWRNINPTQLETFRSWLLDDFSLSSSLVEYAIKEAVRRKRDGQPSLKYIEDNFIEPLKEDGIRTVREAKKYFAQGKNNRRKKDKKNQKKDKNKSWDGFYWDL